MVMMMISGDLYVTLELPTKSQSQSLIPSVPIIIYYILHIAKVLGYLFTSSCHQTLWMATDHDHMFKHFHIEKTY